MAPFFPLYGNRSSGPSKVVWEDQPKDKIQLRQNPARDHGLESDQKVILGIIVRVFCQPSNVHEETEGETPDGREGDPGRCLSSCPVEEGEDDVGEWKDKVA